MKPYEQFNPQWIIENPQWKLLHDLYDKYLLSEAYQTEYPQIPKIIHHIWLGSPFPPHLAELRETWRKFHPDWQLILWTEKEINNFGLVNRRVYDASKNYGSKSDIARYEILYRIGGLYVDTDFECLKPFDDLHAKCSFYSAIGYDSQVLLYNGLIGSIPGHPILKLCIDSMPQQPAGDIWSIMEKTGPHLLTRSFLSLVSLNSGPTIIFPTSFFYSWPAHLRFDKSDAKKWVRPESYAIHYWHTSWQK